MKTRNGFVSNSSSTSFTAIASKRYIEDVVFPTLAKNEFGQLEIEFVKRFGKFEKLEDMEIYTLSYMDGNYENVTDHPATEKLLSARRELIKEKEDYDESRSESMDYFWEFLNSITSLLNSKPHSITFSIDC